jgi:hypothetical protein
MSKQDGAEHQAGGVFHEGKPIRVFFSVTCCLAVAWHGSMVALASEWQSCSRVRALSRASFCDRVIIRVLLVRVLVCLSDSLVQPRER